MLILFQVSNLGLSDKHFLISFFVEGLELRVLEGVVIEDRIGIDQSRREIIFLGNYYSTKGCGVIVYYRPV